MQLASVQIHQGTEWIMLSKAFAQTYRLVTL